MNTMNLKGRDFITLRDFTKAEVDMFLSTAAEMEPVAKGEKVSRILEGKILATLFFEPSTRTQFSFQTAMQRLGGSVIGFSDTKGSSITKGEDFHDTIKVIDSYVDGIAIRHPRSGSAKEAADIAAHPVINGGDGANEHPTQALLDLYTILKEKGQIEGVKIALMGDIRHARSYHSFIPLLARYKAEFCFVTPQELAPSESLLEDLKTNFGLNVKHYENILDVIGEVDIIRLIRVQKERFSSEDSFNRVKGSYVINLDMLKDAKKDMIILHGLPRIDELDRAVDNTPHAAYFRQAYNGVPVRMAILSLLLNGA